jgi:hypothetical protein
MKRLYHETSPEETKEIDKALLSNSELQREYNELVSLKKELDTVQLQPSEDVVNKILNYAHSLQEHH